MVLISPHHFFVSEAECVLSPEIDDVRLLTAACSARACETHRSDYRCCQLLDPEAASTNGRVLPQTG